MSDMSLLGILILDREPYVLANFLGLMQAWLQDAGGFVFAGLLLYILFGIAYPSQSESNKERTAIPAPMLFGFAAALLVYVGYIVLVLMKIGVDKEAEMLRLLRADPNNYIKEEAPKFSTYLQPLLLMVGGLLSLFAASYPVMQAIPTYSFRRIWALARLAFLEALRNRVTWLLLITLLPVLFPMAWFLGSKSENELRLRVSWMSIPLQVILLFTAALLSAFAIPNDVKKQNIFTIVTKPVKRFEMILGRFLGYGLLLTLSCFGATAVSLIFISTSNIDEKAREETYTARVPVRGKLTFESRSSEFIGTDVGREFSYRKYIGGDQLSPQRGVWSFTELPSSLGRAEDDVVPCVFTFDIFRLTKGEENRGVDVNIRAVSYKCGQVPPPPNDGTWEWKDIKLKEEYRTEARELLKKLPRFANQDNFDVTAVLGATPRESKDWPEIWKIANQLAEKYGFFEIPTKEVYDYHPEQVILPAGLFRGASAGTPPNAENGQPQARVKIYVKCTSRSQMLGMAEPDLFVMEAEQSFQQNYLKSAVGLWCRTMIILGMALCISAYLDGIVTFLTVAFLFVAGFFSSYIAEMSTGKSSTGGPFMSLNQLLQAKQPTSVIEGTATDQAALFGDKGFAWVVRRFINLIPDVNAFSWTQFVSEGFNVSNEYLIMNVLTLLGYLIPWFLLGFYLIRSREVAA